MEGRDQESTRGLSGTPGLCPWPGLARRQPRCPQSTHHGVSKGKLRNHGKLISQWQSWEMIPGALFALGSIRKQGAQSCKALAQG